MKKAFKITLGILFAFATFWAIIAAVFFVAYSANSWWNADTGYEVLKIAGLAVASTVAVGIGKQLKGNA